MKAFVTGANGFTGSHLVKALEKRGDQVVGWVRKSSDLSRLVDTQVQLAFGELVDQPALEAAMQGVDVVFHTAAYVELGIVDEARMERVNVDGTRAVLGAAKAAGVSRVIYCSTIGVYGDTQGQVIDETFKRTQQGFSSGYDRTKYEAQQMADQFAREGLSVVSIMPSGIFGADDPHFGPVLDRFLKGQLKVWPGGDRITGIVHVDDLVEAMLLAADKGKTGDHYIISSGEMTIRQMFEFFSQQTGVSVPAEAPELLVRIVGNVLDPIGRLLQWQPFLSRERVHYIYDRCVRVDATRARRELAWNPRPIEETLKDCLNRRQPAT